MSATYIDTTARVALGNPKKKKAISVLSVAGAALNIPMEGVRLYLEGLAKLPPLAAVALFGITSPVFFSVLLMYAAAVLLVAGIAVATFVVAFIAWGLWKLNAHSRGIGSRIVAKTGVVFPVMALVAVTFVLAPGKAETIINTVAALPQAAAAEPEPAITKPTQRSASTIAGVPAEYVQLYDDAAARCKSTVITGAVLAAQGKRESDNFAPDVIDGRRRSPAGAMGIAQFMPSTWKKEWGDPYNPVDAIRAQGKKMCDLTHDHIITTEAKKTNGSILNLALAGYNAGPGRVDQFNGMPPCSFARCETTNYVTSILDFLGTYDGLSPQLAKAAREMAIESNHNIWLNEGKRTPEKQDELHALFLAGKGAPAFKSSDPLAHHVTGEAIDMNGLRDQVEAAAKAKGLCQPYLSSTNEWWHFEAC